MNIEAQKYVISLSPLNFRKKFQSYTKNQTITENLNLFKKNCSNVGQDDLMGSWLHGHRRKVVVVSTTFREV